MHNRHLFQPALLAMITMITLLLGCAGTPNFDTTKVDKALTPQRVITEPSITLDKIALWGGTILDTHNLKESTQIEVLAYPLDSYHRPLLEQKPLGRFIVKHPGFLEPTTYSQGRLLSVVGSVSGSQSGKIGETSYSYPVIKAQQLHLWSQGDLRGETTFHFGIGIRL